MIGESRLLESWGKCSFVGNEDYFRGNNEFVSLLARVDGNLRNDWNIYIQTPMKMNSISIVEYYSCFSIHMILLL